MRSLAGALTLALTLVGPTQATPEIQHWQTQSGAKVLFVEAPDLPMLDIRIVFDAGSARDGDTPGLAKLTNAVLDQGAGPWSADEIAQRMESVGAELGNDSLRDMAYLSLRTLTEPAPLKTALETLTQVLTAPRFALSDVDRILQAMGATLKSQQQSPGAIVKRRFMQALYGDHPYAIHSDGTEASLAALTPEQARAFHRRLYVANNAVVAMVGAVQRPQAEAIAEQLTAALPAGEPAPKLPEPEPLSEARSVKVAFPSAQSHLRIGQIGMRRGDPDYFPLYVGNHVLGGSGLVSRLGEEVREKRGLSYSVYSYFSPMHADGPFMMGAQTQNAQALQAQTVMMDTLRRFIEHGPEAADLARSKKNITGGFPLDIASNSKILGYLAMIGFYDLPLDYLDNFVQRIEAVDAAAIREAFQRRLHPERMLTVVVGRQVEPAESKAE